MVKHASLNSFLAERASISLRSPGLAERVTASLWRFHVAKEPQVSRYNVQSAPLRRCFAVCGKVVDQSVGNMVEVDEDPMPGIS